MLPQDVTASGSVNVPPIAQAWDPYDVWLTRVKLPRERQPQHVAAAEVQAAPASEARSTAPSVEAPLLLPGIS